MSDKKKKIDYNSIAFKNKDIDRLGMLSIKHGIDNNPGVTRADVIAGATKGKKGKKKTA